jgi:hypothetical protein
MKITGINEDQSTDHSVALYTNPPLTGDIFTQVQRLMRPPGRDALKGVGIGIDGACLVLRTPSFSQEMAMGVEELLTAAEKAVQMAQDAEKQKAQAEKTAKQNAMEAAAKAFGVSIR